MPNLCSGGFKYVSMYKPYSPYSASGYISDPTATVRLHPSVPGDGRRRTELEGFVEHREKSTRGNVYILDFWLAVHGKPVLFWKGISGLKFPCFRFMHANGTGPFEFRAVPIL